MTVININSETKLHWVGEETQKQTWKTIKQKYKKKNNVSIINHYIRLWKALINAKKKTPSITQ